MILRRHWQATTNWSVITRNLCGNPNFLIASKNSFNGEWCKNEQERYPQGTNSSKQFDVFNSATVFWPHSRFTTKTNNIFFLYNCWLDALNDQQIIMPYIVVKKFRVRRRIYFPSLIFTKKDLFVGIKEAIWRGRILASPRFMTICFVWKLLTIIIFHIQICTFKVVTKEVKKRIQ